VLLAERGKSVKDLALFIGMNQASVSKLFKLGTTREQTAERIAEFLSVPISEIVNPHYSSGETRDEKIKDLEHIISLQDELIKELRRKP
jgi:DNA-binding Xre family transcriptional regulator